MVTIVTIFAIGFWFLQKNLFPYLAQVAETQAKTATREEEVAAQNLAQAQKLLLEAKQKTYLVW